MLATRVEDALRLLVRFALHFVRAMLVSLIERDWYRLGRPVQHLVHWTFHHDRRQGENSE